MESQMLTKIFVVSTCIMCVSSYVLKNATTGPAEEGDALPHFVSCYTNNGQTPMEGIVPHPQDCNRYFACIPGNFGNYEPVLLDCQTGHDGNLLYYDFKKCWCEVRSIAQCYDEAEAEYEEFYTCARPAQNIQLE